MSHEGRERRCGSEAQRGRCSAGACRPRARPRGEGSGGAVDARGAAAADAGTNRVLAGVLARARIFFVCASVRMGARAHPRAGGARCRLHCGAVPDRSASAAGVSARRSEPPQCGGCEEQLGR